MINHVALLQRHSATTFVAALTSITSSHNPTEKLSYMGDFGARGTEETERAERRLGTCLKCSASTCRTLPRHTKHLSSGQSGRKVASGCTQERTALVR
jgi:hypothetical protein